MSRIRIVRCLVLAVVLAALAVEARPATAADPPILFHGMLYEKHEAVSGVVAIDLFLYMDGVETRLTSSPANERTPKWSPDGRQIAYSSNAGGTPHIRVMNADGSNQHPITASGSWPSWSPRGTKIAFVMNSEIYVVNADGSNLTRLTNNAWIDDYPSWGPLNDIVFVSNQFGNVNPEIFTMTETGSNQTRLTNNTAFDIEPTHSHDGGTIYWASYPFGGPNFAIWAMTSSGQTQTNLTPWSPVNVVAPSSCAGTIAAQSLFFGPNWGILLMQLDGSGAEPLQVPPGERHKPDIFCGAPTLVNQLIVKEVGYDLGPVSQVGPQTPVTVEYRALVRWVDDASGFVVNSTYPLGPATVPTAQWPRLDVIVTSLRIERVSPPFELEVLFELNFNIPGPSGNTFTYRNTSQACRPTAGDSECRWNLAEGIGQSCVGSVCGDPCSSTAACESIRSACDVLPMACQDAGQAWVTLYGVHDGSKLDVTRCVPTLLTYERGVENDPAGASPTASPPIADVNRAGAKQLKVHGRQTGKTVVTVEVLNREFSPPKKETWTINLNIVLP